MNIALFGAGLMGFPMAEKLLQAGFSTAVFNRTTAKAEPLREQGARIAYSAAEAVSFAEALILMLSDYSAIREVLFPKKAPPDLKDRTVIQMGTILPGESRQLFEEIGRGGGEYLEAPVLGSIPNVKEKNLIVMVGSTRDQFQQYEKIFRAFGSDIYWVGEVGKAAAVKLALNQLIVSLTAAFSLSLGIVQKSGADVDVFMAILRHSALYAPTFDKKLPRMLERNFSEPNFPVKLLLKDVNLIFSEAESLGLNTVLLKAIREILTLTMERQLADADYSALFEAIYPAK